MPANPIPARHATRLSLTLLLLTAVLDLTIPAGDVHAAAPLDAAETARADQLAREVPLARERARSDATTHTLGLQSVVIEPEFRKRATADERRARVYQYDHASQRSRLVRIDLVTDAVLGSRPIGGHHLPLSIAEQRWALDRLAAETILIARLQAEQTRRGQPAFNTLDELDVKASVFEPADEQHPCARERCALLSLFDVTRTVFATEPLVRFANGDVTTLAAMAVGADAR